MDKAEDNKVVGHYYEVSRRIITDVKDGNVAYGNAASYYYNDKNLYSVDRLPVTDTDLDKDVKYYSINGRPEINGKDSDDYKGVLLSVVNGFDGTPDIKAESDSTLVESFVNDKFDDADTYEIADLARKIDGDIVAAFAFEDSLGETDKDSTLVESFVNDKFDDADTYEIADLARKIDGDIVAAFAFEDSLGETDKKADSVVVDVDKNAAKAVPNDGADHDIADVKNAIGGGNVTADVKVYKDGKEVSDVTAKLVNKDLKVNAQKGAATGDYVAKFTVDKTTYEVKFSVVAADVVVPAFSEKHVPAFSEKHTDGLDAVQEKNATSTLTFKGKQETGATKCAVTVGETKVTVDLAANDGPNLAAGKVAKAISEKFIDGVTAVANDAVVTVTGKGVDTVLNFQKGSLTVLDAEVDNANAKHVAAAEATSAVAEITFKSGVNVDSTITVKVGDASADVALKAGDTAEQVAAKVAAASFTAEITFKSGVNVDSTITVKVGDASADVALKAGDTAEQVAAKVAAASFTGYTVKADGAKVTFTSDATGNRATISTVSVAAKA